MTIDFFVLFVLFGFFGFFVKNLNFDYAFA